MNIMNLSNMTVDLTLYTHQYAYRSYLLSTTLVS